MIVAPPHPPEVLSEALSLQLQWVGLLQFWWLLYQQQSVRKSAHPPRRGSSTSASPPRAEAQLSCLQVVFDQYREGDVVWVQDYHLMLLPALLKQRHPRMKVMPRKCTPLSVSVHRGASRTQLEWSETMSSRLTDRTCIPSC